MLKIGQLAKHAGITIRTLHHYDDIGLLHPSVRSDAGYRLYGRDDVARLQQIQALRQLGMPLADIGHFLGHSGSTALAIVERQMAALDRQMQEAARMRAHLQHLHDRLGRGEEPELADWLSTLEQMKMYEKYFSKEELANLPMYHDDVRRAEWAALVGNMAQLMVTNTPVTSLAAKQLGARWIDMLDGDTGGDWELIGRLDTMHINELAVQHSTGISMAMRAYVAEILGELKLDAYARYLLPAELERMRRHQRNHVDEWFPLFAEIRKQMEIDPAGISDASRQVAGTWQALFRGMIGDNPATLSRFRQAVENEPQLRIGRGMTDEMIGWLRTNQPPA